MAELTNHRPVRPSDAPSTAWQTSAVTAIRVLGPVGALGADGNELKLGGVKPRALLAYLAVNVGREVAVSAIVDAVWGEGAPDTVVNTLQVNVSSLRRALAGCGASIERTAGAYRLNAPLSVIDVHVVEGLIAEGRSALRSSRPDRGLELLTNALAHFRGRPFDGLDAAPFVEWVRPSLERLRRTAMIEQIECLQQLDRYDHAIVEAERLVGVEPFDERCWAMLMSSYYWAGRQSDALQTFQRARRVLADELGLEPGPDLVALERAVLEHSVAAPRHARPQPDGADDGPLLPAMRMLVGRDAFVERVEALLDVDQALVTLVGLGGIGKTSVAITVAHRMAAQGQAVWFVDVSAAGDAEAAATAVVQAVAPGGVSGDPLDDLSSWARRAAGYLVLDNLEQVADVIRLVGALRAQSQRLRVLATSRRALRVRGEHVLTVPPLPIDATGSSEGAAALLARRAAEVRPDLVDLDVGFVTEVCELTAGIPLAIELAALQLRALSPDHLLRRLRSFAAVSLDFAATDDYPERQRSLRSVLESTTTMLPPAADAVLLRCATISGPVSLDLLEQICLERGLDGLGHLADLVEAGLAARIARGDVVTLPVPVRSHVLARSDPDARSRAEDDLVRAVHDLLTDAEGSWYGPAAQHHLARCRTDAAAIDASVAVLRERGAWTELADLALLLAPYWLQQSRFNDALAVLDSLLGVDLPDDLAHRIRLSCGTFASYLNRNDTVDLLAPALADDRGTQFTDRLTVNAWCCLGAFHAHHHADDAVRTCVAAATDVAARSGDAVLVALARDFAGYAASYLGDSETAVALTLEAIDDARRQGDHHALALLLANAAEVLLQADRFEEAKVLADEAFDVARKVDLGVATGWVLLMSGATDLALGRPAAAWGSLIEHLRFVTARHPDPLVIGDSLAILGATRAALGEVEAACRVWGAATAIHSDQGVDPSRRRLRVVQQHWDATSDRIGAARFDALVLTGATSAHRIIDELLARDDGGGELRSPPPSSRSVGTG
jgi:DNA-binding SARP family transcriptional activator/predicted ATPase